MYVGARILKTGIAVTLAMYLCKILHVEPAVFAAISVVVNMQPSVRKALHNAWEQVWIHLLSVALAVLLGLALGTSPMVTGLAVILIILLCNRLGWSGGITIGVVSIVFVLDSPANQFLYHAGIRSLAVFLGLGVALGVNHILLPPAHKKKLYNELDRLFRDASTYFLDRVITFISSASLVSFIAEPPAELLERLDIIMDLYEHGREELTEQDNPKLVERVLEICQGFIERGQIIGEMTAQRIQRRNAPDSRIPIDGLSPEYQRILDVLLEGERKLGFWARKVNIGLNQPHASEKAKEDLEYWAEFDQVMDTWQRTVSGVFYLRAMMEIAVVATELRWAERRMRKLYDLGSFNQE
ncbi:aromatic acid exporter family protein [Desulfosporosinus sp. Sb-LF]|uniref:FUSC family protein n=1 Tax=Desulfosporosinus sp. Sb-LF TaxID=2560027 RepID=UPI00107F6B9C|nr:aromatic acid exporter family protein [Desulfosporosinus sp. Sb-LF]TGE33275.1 aromatic acid exporter family protein [Desulfosporosinus sp. Sb-LF]